MKGVKTMSVLTNIVPRKEQNLGTHFVQGTALAVLLTGLSFLVGVQMGWVTDLNLLEIFAVFTSYLCTFLCVVERRSNYPIGAVSNAAYSYLFFQWGLYASSFVTGYLTIALAYGWFRWRSDKETIPVRHVELKWVPVYVLTTAVFYAVAFFVVTSFGGTLAMTDSFILVGSILAQFLLDNKRIETWMVWAVVNVFAIYTYATAGLPLAAFQYVFFLANVFYGYVMWKKSMRQEQAAKLDESIKQMHDGDGIILRPKEVAIWTS
jgi:nicotinamide mononucleotide transporter